MNRQLNYIINAFLVLLLLLAGSFFINLISSGESSKKKSIVIVDYITSPSTENIIVLKGKNLFLTKCASCHNIFKEGSAPALLNFEERHKWANRKELYSWMRNPSAYMKKDEYTRGLKVRYGSVMTAFPDLSNEEIDAICEYIGSGGIVKYGIP